MQLNLEHPDHEFLLRGADGGIAVVNDRQLNSSFIIAPDRLVEAFVSRLTVGRVQLSALLVPSLILHTIGAKNLRRRRRGKSCGRGIDRGES